MSNLLPTQADRFTRSGISLIQIVMQRWEDEFETTIELPYHAVWLTLCALRHACDATSIDFDAALELSENQYRANVANGHLTTPF